MEVENTGGRDGDEVVQLYITAPFKALAGFRRIALKPKERRTVEFTLLLAAAARHGFLRDLGWWRSARLLATAVARSFRIPQP